MPLSETALAIVAFLALVGCGTMAGLFFVFSNTVMRALSRLSPGAAVAAMNAVNVEIVNPLFLAVFLGTPAICLFLAVHALLYPGLGGTAYLLAGSAIYLAGALLVTILFNVPRNDALARVDPAGPDAEAAWHKYLGPWLRWNHVRTGACLVATVLLGVGTGELLATVR